MEISEVVELSKENLDEKGCYCLRSQPRSTGYRHKNEWLKDRFGEGLKYIKIMENNKPAGFIEYTPIEYSSRVVYGKNYIVIHCLWVGITGKGYASTLIQHCIEEAKVQNKAGIIVVTNPNTSWTPSKEVFINNKFVEVDHAPYGFELLVYKLKESPNPYFPNDWEERLKPHEELTILRTQQCPFITIATDNVLVAANKLNLELEIIDLKTREELMRLSPTPYGVYGVIYKKKLIAFHRLTAYSALKKLRSLSEEVNLV
ncbi:GNAT family N-acetyltransferase [Paucisalibacillus globulus]|uniref:GNAT family N-acetyltransferase n=1 Tax=Paucisalibacillus globulus TaxID=351095 RepID=UPI00041F8FED|nr:GNAT family N-acetyltransferase [Paucisalibacillus globulus]